ncbi:PhzF family phenazine biosynthesis protein [Diaminobutyricimonas aerilata]|uniref:PhzF family phenazine biosynthesis protein n=1 Tax=Diaminobutyricimonas aerilata TaxID=1162967 RepID=A0A2M9CFU3_9MICO|nr:PhzF family phenazine biosynthesis protein [Diaminobutyricimonas aerilata]PJJ70715.1 PhzF family phenazine biosynthesis protein [Diaminobutyricimonas aerilata]
MGSTAAARTLKYRAFTTPDGGPDSGNPAGVVLDAERLSENDMLSIAADLGFSETAFLTEITDRSARIRYFTPRAEIAFCGHATIASGVALARQGAGPVIELRTNAGEVPVEVTPERATLTAVETAVEPLDPSTLSELLEALRLTEADLDPALPPAFIRGGNPHPLVPVRADALARLDHDADAVLTLQNRQGWDGTVPVVHRVSEHRFFSRNPFPRGGIREDPATGSAAAGLGAYLRHGGHVASDAEITVEQGSEVGRPSLISVTIPSAGRIRVTGTADELGAGSSD